MKSDPPDDERKRADRRAKRLLQRLLRNRSVLMAVLKVAAAIVKLVRLIFDWFGAS